MTLTPHQQAVYDYLTKFSGRMISSMTIGLIVGKKKQGLASKWALDRLKRLEELGLVEHTENGWRAV